jgi:hypothetical protein
MWSRILMAAKRDFGASQSPQFRKGVQESEMKTKISSIADENTAQLNRQALAEIEVFLAALASYPEQFAVDHGLSFEEHRSRLMRNVRGQRSVAASA